MASPARHSPDTADRTDDACSITRVYSWSAGGALRPGSDCVAEEVPVAFEYNGIAHAVMLASPTCLEDFATGFSLTEGIVASASDIHDIDMQTSSMGITVRLNISPRAFFHLKEKRRTLAGRTGCGLCGAERLEQVYRRPAPVSARAEFSPDSVQSAFEVLVAGQPLMQRTGATHAAAWMDESGQIALIREDVGRHNALDKLIGALAAAGTDASGGAVLITSRASYEMVLKSAAADIGLLAAISAPTRLAVELAESAHMTLAGFVRKNKMVVYSHPERLDCSRGPQCRSAT